MRWPGADRSVVARKALQWGWSEGIGSDNHRFETTGDRMTSSAMKDKPFKIDKRQVYKAYKAVKSNQGAAGVDGQTLKQFETDWKRNLYRIWNRMSSGSYFPPPVRAVSIPKKNGGERILGVPTVSDRIAQVVVKQLIETEMESIFLPDSYGYRPGKSALDAVGVTRERCWKYDWVLEFDIKGLFDNIDHALLLKAVRKHVTCDWALLYIERWLTAPMEQQGARTERTRGTPQGGVVSPLLANIYMRRFVLGWKVGGHEERLEAHIVNYADDFVICCSSGRGKEAMTVMRQMMGKLKLTVNEKKTRLCRLP